MAEFEFENTHPYDVNVTDLLQKIECTQHDYRRLCELVETESRTQAICDCFQYLIANSDMNPTVLWNGILRVAYVNTIQDRTLQSWRSASGSGFERFLSAYYTNRTQPNIRIEDHTDTEKESVITQLGLTSEVGDSKVDLTIQYKQNNHWHIVGHIAAKTSLRERLAEDYSASRQFMKKNILSVAFTLDAQYELGSPNSTTENRSLVIDRNAFDYLFSLNKQTKPSENTDRYTVQKCTLGSNTDMFIDTISWLINKTDESLLTSHPIVQSTLK